VVADMWLIAAHVYCQQPGKNFATFETGTQSELEAMRWLLDSRVEGESIVSCRRSNGYVFHVALQHSIIQPPHNLITIFHLIRSFPKAA